LVWLLTLVGERGQVFPRATGQKERPDPVPSKLAHHDAVLLELSGIPDQAGRTRERAHRDRSVVGSHAAERTARDQHGVGAQLRGAKGRTCTGRSGPDDKDGCAGHRRSVAGRAAIAYPGILDKLSDLKLSSAAVVEDGTAITSRGPGTAMDFALLSVARNKASAAAISRPLAST
jgi:hypothetical protein